MLQPLTLNPAIGVQERCGDAPENTLRRHIFWLHSSRAENLLFLMPQKTKGARVLKQSRLHNLRKAISEAKVGQEFLPVEHLSTAPED